MNPLSYRFASEHDAAALAQLNLQLIHEGADCGEEDLQSLQARMQRWLKTRRYRGVLFHYYGASEILAYALFSERSYEIYLRQFMVLPTARRQGIGRHALDLLRSRIWSARKRLVVEALTRNVNGLAFWRSLGFCDYAVTLEIPQKLESANL